jgi:elongation factor P hydroxylase
MTQPAKHLKAVTHQPDHGWAELQAQAYDAMTALVVAALAYVDEVIRLSTLLGDDRVAAESRRYAAVLREQRGGLDERAVKFRAAGERG